MVKLTVLVNGREHGYLFPILGGRNQKIELQDQYWVNAISCKFFPRLNVHKKGWKTLRNKPMCWNYILCIRSALSFNLFVPIIWHLQRLHAVFLGHPCAAKKFQLEHKVKAIRATANASSHCDTSQWDHEEWLFHWHITENIILSIIGCWSASIGIYNLWAVCGHHGHVDASERPWHYNKHCDMIWCGTAWWLSLLNNGRSINLKHPQKILHWCFVNKFVLRMTAEFMALWLLPEVPPTTGDLFLTPKR